MTAPRNPLKDDPELIESIREYQEAFKGGEDVASQIEEANRRAAEEEGRQAPDRRTRPLPEGWDKKKEPVIGVFSEWLEAKYRRVGERMEMLSLDKYGNPQHPQVLTVREWATETYDTTRMPPGYPGLQGAPASSVVHPQHYNRGKIEVWHFIRDQRLGFFEGNVVKYVCRAQDKGGIEDLKKAREYISELIRLEEERHEDSKARAPDGGAGR